MSDVLDEFGTARRPTPALKFDEDNLVRHLLYVFFSHQPVYAQLVENPDSRRGAIETLLRMFSLVADAIEQRQFDRKVFPWVTDDLISENFVGRDFNQYYKAFRDEHLPYKATRSTKFRQMFSAMCAVSRDVFYKGESSDFEFVGEGRRLLKVEGPVSSHRKQVDLLGRIENELRKITNKPNWPISFDKDDQPVIKIKRAGPFPSPSAVVLETRYVVGRFIMYRRAFTPGFEYIREHLVVEPHRYGLTFRWETRGGPRNREAAFLGVVFFTDGAFWMLGHCQEPFPRIRVLSGSLAEWQRHYDEPVTNPMCSAQMLSHRQEERQQKIPTLRTIVLRRQTDEDWRDEPHKDRVRFMTHEEVGRVLSQEQIDALDVAAATDGAS